MAGRDINVPFGPDRTNGVGFEPIPAEGAEEQGVRDPFAASQPETTGYGNTGSALTSIPEVQPTPEMHPIPEMQPTNARTFETSQPDYNAAVDVPTMETASKTEEPDAEYSVEEYDE